MDQPLPDDAQARTAARGAIVMTDSAHTSVKSAQANAGSVETEPT
ncbi:hypothetical protein [Streptomyces sp. NPDC050263]